MLSRTSRILTFGMALLYTLLGLVLFLAPSWSAANFSWKISPFVAMTIGGWCLGNAVLAWEAGRVWRWSAVYPTLLYLWIFGLAELGVLVLFRSKLILDASLAWPYILTLAVSVIAAVVGVVDWLSLRPPVLGSGRPNIPFARIATALFVILVGLLGVLGWFAAPSRVVQESLIFPELLSPFTVRAFAAFYFSLAVSVIPLLWATELEATARHARAALGLIVFITAAALFNLDKFDFGARPGGLIYFGAYLLVFCVILVGLWLNQRPQTAVVSSPP